MSIERVYIDTKDVAAKLSFLVGKTILFRNGVGDSTTATPVLAVKAENGSGAEGRPCVSIYTTVGVQTLTDSDKFNNIMVLETDGTLTNLGKYTTQMGVCFR